MSAEAIDRESVVAALRGIRDPRSGTDLVESGRIQGLEVRERQVAFTIEIVPREAEGMEETRKLAEQAVAGIPGVDSVRAVLTAHRDGGPRGRAQAGAQARGAAAKEPRQRPAILPNVGAIIAVASGKGGVGKSTTAVNVALSLRALGQRVGLLDADVYGPSQPRLLGIRGRPRADADKKLLPMEGYGIVCMSMGFLIEDESPMIWRGPMVAGALTQMMREVAWGRLDVLIVDMPPGTGDAQLTLAQQVALAGAVIVSTPQDIALIDARKGLAMFRRVDVPILGIIENMSYFLCPHCGGRSEIFTHGGAKREAERSDAVFLGAIPLDPLIRETSDGGRPIAVSAPESAQAMLYVEIARKILDQLDVQRGQREAPGIVVQ